MRYRNLRNLEERVSALGFGCMRLPANKENGEIDEPQARDMVRFAIDNGVDYVDTAYPYHDGNSESFLGRALQDGYREKVKLATKMPIWLIEKPDDMDRYFQEQLDKLQTDRIEFYLFHCLGTKDWKNLKEHGAIPWIEQQKANKRIGNIGFSFHDTADEFKAIIDDYAGWDFTQIQYNYTNEDTQAGTEGLRYAHKAILDQNQRRRQPADWALQWLWNKPEVATVLSGMSTMDQVRQKATSIPSPRPNWR